MHRNRLLLIGSVLLLAGIITAANLGQFSTASSVQKQEAQQRALYEVTNVANLVPNIKRLLTKATANPAQLGMIDALASHGEIAAVLFFDRSGRQILNYKPKPWTTDPSLIAQRETDVSTTLATGAAQVLAEHSDTNAALPGLYSAAYLPVNDRQGVRLGAIGVYLDMSKTHDLFNSEFLKLSVMLTTVFTLVIVLLFGGYVLWRRRAGQSQQQVDYLARYDQLTGVFNRGGFYARLREMRQKGQVLPAQTAVFFFDLDNFKWINDTRGHRAGDDLLRHVGEMVRNALGPNDIAGRFGGDEFVIIAQLDNVADAVAHAERLQAQIAQPVLSGGTTIVTGASVGVLFGIRAEDDIEDDIHRADLALFQAKMDGRNTCRVFSSELEDRINRRMKVECAVNRGLEEGLFTLVYQPIINRTSGRCIGFEALLRLTDADGTPISPAEFIPVAETNGAIRAIGSWVLDTAVAEAVRWSDDFFVSVNMSARQFDDENLVDAVRMSLDTHGLNPGRLELEVTESLLIDNTESVGRQLMELRALGISISMDDFGTGYSSLGYLWKYGFDKIKIDRSFILGLDTDTARVSEILDTIIILSHRLNLKVTAEGIETERQARLLSDMSCDQFQGYLYGRPMPPDDLPGFILKNVYGVLDSGTGTDTGAQRRSLQQSSSTA